MSTEKKVLTVGASLLSSGYVIMLHDDGKSIAVSAGPGLAFDVNDEWAVSLFKLAYDLAKQVSSQKPMSPSPIHGADEVKPQDCQSGAPKSLIVSDGSCTITRESGTTLRFTWSEDGGRMDFRCPPVVGLFDLAYSGYESAKTWAVDRDRLMREVKDLHQLNSQLTQALRAIRLECQSSMGGKAGIKKLADFALGNVDAAKPGADEAPKPDADGWIKWEGGECPVLKGVRVQVRLRNGDEPVQSRPAERWVWTHERMGSDIMAYRLADSMANRLKTDSPMTIEGRLAKVEADLADARRRLFDDF